MKKYNHYLIELNSEKGEEMFKFLLLFWNLNFSQSLKKELIHPSM